MRFVLQQGSLSSETAHVHTGATCPAFLFLCSGGAIHGHLRCAQA